MGSPETTNQLPLLSLTSQERIEHLHFDARVRLRRALDTVTYGRAEELKIDGNPKVHEIVIAYAVEVLHIAMREYGALGLEPNRARAVMLTLVNRTYAETRNLLIPQCRVDLGKLQYDDVFKKRLADELLRLSAAASSPDDEKCSESNATKLIDGYLERESVALSEFAEKARVDVSAVRALRRGERRCGPEALKRIASVLGCDVKELLPKSEATAKAEEKAGV